MPERTKVVVAIAADHAGYELKERLKATLNEVALEVLDLGTSSTDSVDYPDYGHKLAHAITQGRAQYGVGICGSGIGISIALNRHKGIRAALCSSGLLARFARKHNDANVLCLGARFTGEEIAKDCVKEFFATAFEGGRHEQRVSKLESITS